MLAAAGRSRIVTLDIPGKPWTTEQLAVQLEAWKLDGRDVALLVGGPEGFPRVQGCRGTELVALAPDPAPSPGAGTGGREPLPRLEHHHQSPLSQRVTHADPEHAFLLSHPHVSHKVTAC